jgi:hypothetical protein
MKKEKTCGCRNCQEREWAEYCSREYEIELEFWLIIKFNFPDYRGKEDGA